MKQLLDIEHSTYDRLALYAYFEEPGEATFPHKVEGPKGRAAAWVAERLVLKQWQTFEESGAGRSPPGKPFVLP